MDIEHFDNELDANIREVYQPFSVEEQQEALINKSNAKLVFQPKFIPFYPHLMKLNLTHLDVILYGFIDFYMSNSKGGRFYFTNEQLASILSCAEDTITRSLKRLETAQLLKVHRKVKANGGLIRFVNLSISEPTISQLGNREKRKEIDNKINNNKKNLYIDQQVDRKHDKRAAEDATQQRFAQFWGLYPRHIAKKKALEIYSKLGEETQNLIIEVLPRYKFGNDVQFIPHPSTWLNQHRWEDEQSLVTPHSKVAEEALTKTATEKFNNYIDNLLLNAQK